MNLSSLINLIFYFSISSLSSLRFISILSLFHLYFITISSLFPHYFISISSLIHPNFIIISPLFHLYSITYDVRIILWWNSKITWIFFQNGMPTQSNDLNHGAKLAVIKSTTYIGNFLKLLKFLKKFELLCKYLMK